MDLTRYESEVVQIILASVEAAGSCKKAHDTLGDNGLMQVHTNQHGETALTADVGCEIAVIEQFKQYLTFPFRVRSEEHGDFVQGIGEPQFLLMLDGLDGSGVYVSTHRTGEYGTMFAFFHGADPCFEDFVCSFVVQHAIPRICIACRFGEAYWYENRFNIQHLYTNGRTHLQSDSRIRVDEHFEINRNTFSKKLSPKFSIEYTKCSAQSYVDVAIGKADAALECTRKGNLEIAVAYPLIRSAGGVIVDLDGNDIGKQKVLTWKQDVHEPVITAATMDLAQDIIRIIQL